MDESLGLHFTPGLELSTHAWFGLRVHVIHGKYINFSRPPPFLPPLELRMEKIFCGCSRPDIDVNINIAVDMQIQTL